MVRVKRGTFEYEPRPLKLDDVMIEAELLDLRESIAENAHEVWAAGRKKEGWSYGPERDDQKKLHPDMIAYADLTDSEKQYDRDMAINTIKLVKKLGFDIVPQNKPEYFCPECGAPVSKAHVYCSQCGHKLSNGIFMKK
jgi:DNA-directed RNA polymerase subunit RPC12/RpoP